MEQGKPLAEATGEVLASAGLIEFHAAEGQRVYGRVLMRPPGMRSMVLHQPVGPVAAFCAWNFPALNVVRKIAPAIAAGCSIILKPQRGNARQRGRGDALLPGCRASPADVAQIVFGVPDQISRHLLSVAGHEEAELHRLGPGRQSI